MERKLSAKVTSLLLSLVLLFCFPIMSYAEGEDCDHFVDQDYGVCTNIDEDHHTVTGICEYCGQEVTVTEEHDWYDWEVTKRATVFKKGTKSRECAYCDATQTKTIARVKPFAKFKKKSYSVVAGKALRMKLKLKMGKGDKVKKWKVSNSKIASISKYGKIKAKKKGTIKVTAILKSGKKATCTVKVKAPKKAKAKKKSSGGSTVYWVPNGDVYHVSRNCRTLKRSKTVYSGTIKESGKSRCCKVCG